MPKDEPQNQHPYELTGEDDLKFRNGTEYYIRTWEDAQGNGQPIVIINEHFNNQGPKMTDDIAGQIGVSVCKEQSWNPQEVNLYRQELNGELRGYEYNSLETEKSRADDLNQIDQQEADRVLGKEKITHYFAKGHDVSPEERERVESLQGDLRQPWDINRKEVPQGFDRTKLKTEYEQPDKKNEPDIER